MKKLLIILPFLVFLGCSNDANAGCVGLDVGIQTTVTGQNSRVSQSNRSTIQTSDDCLGASGVNTSSQTAITDGDVVQQRSSTIILEGGNTTGVNTRSVELQMNPRTNIRVRETR